MIQIGTTNELGQFSGDWMNDTFSVVNYSNLALALSDLIALATAAPDLATNASAGAFASRDTETGTITTYNLDQLNGTVEIREEFDYVEYEVPLSEFLKDALKSTDVMSQLQMLMAGKQLSITDIDGQPFPFKLRPRGASNSN